MLKSREFKEAANENTHNRVIMNLVTKQVLMEEKWVNSFRWWRECEHFYGKQINESINVFIVIACDIQQQISAKKNLHAI